MRTTDTNEYATGLNDENEWEESIIDYDIPLDERIDDFFGGFADSHDLYNETGFGGNAHGEF
jgi:hypothetical protein